MLIKKLDRNAPCPCGSGRKYKHCCRGKQTPVPRHQQPTAQHRMTLQAEIAEIRDAAHQRQQRIREIGVFILVSYNNGDAWLLENLQQDALCLALDGIDCPTNIQEGSETIEVDWSHHFQFKGHQVQLTPYPQDEKSGQDEPVVLDKMLSKKLATIQQTILKRYPRELWGKVHLSQDTGLSAPQTADDAPPSR